QIIQSASETAASCMGLKNVGALRAGNWADFVVLDADPLVNITNTRKINGVFISGAQVGNQ
ncbi:MAG TPA: amidohydrolase family protein, partial [Cyclobacteriaceae bacterium]|nr:amidohydrolase family protein [Cyclobacteriaceae bacterium]